MMVGMNVQTKRSLFKWAHFHTEYVLIKYFIENVKIIIFSLTPLKIVSSSLGVFQTENHRF